MQIINTERIPIKMWLHDVEPGAMDQLKNLANLPFAFRHVAVMPDGGGFTARRMLPLSLTFDHRAVTGGEAARFLAAAIAHLETEFS